MKNVFELKESAKKTICRLEKLMQNEDDVNELSKEISAIQSLVDLSFELYKIKGIVDNA